MLCAAKEEISILPVIGESVLPLAADLFAADPAFVETRIPKKSQLGENSHQGFGSTNRASHPSQTAAKSTLALGVSWFASSGTAVGSGVVYDGDGNRVSETVGGTTTKYLVDSLNPTSLPQVIDELVSGAVTRTYAYGLQRISENQKIGTTQTASFYGYDGHGHVRVRRLRHACHHHRNYAEQLPLQRRAVRQRAGDVLPPGAVLQSGHRAVPGDGFV